MDIKPQILQSKLSERCNSRKKGSNSLYILFLYVQCEILIFDVFVVVILFPKTQYYYWSIFQLLEPKFTDSVLY